MSDLRGYYIKNIGENKGKPRLWFDGHEMKQSGMKPGQSYEIVIEGRSITLKANANGTRVVTSKKKKDDTVIPVIDLNSDKLLSIFDGMDAVRVVIREHEIVIVPLASELKRVEREKRLLSKLTAGESLAVGSMYHGGGIMSHAMHKGLGNAGIPSHISFVNENRKEMVDHAAEHNSAWTENTKVFQASAAELAFDDRATSHIPRTEIMEMGIPCNAASTAGRAKTGISMPEANEEVGHLIVATIVILNKSNPAIAMFENVPSYANTASASILRTQMKAFGYNLHEKVLNGNDFGSLENRNRWVMVAVSRGLEFDLENLISIVGKPDNLGAVLEDISDDDPRWSAMQGLKDKEVRDMAEGKGFRMQIYSSESESIGTLTKGYAKIRSTDPKVRHPSNPDLLRQLTAHEHAAIKGIPAALIDGSSNTLGHEIAGQSVIYPKIEAVGTHIGNALHKMADVEYAQTPRNSISAQSTFPPDIAEMAEKIGCKLFWAKPNLIYQGRIQGIGEGHFIQDAGQNTSVIHDDPEILEKNEISLGAEVKIVVAKDKSITITAIEKQQMALGI